jgi:hypothetical protein
MLVIRLSAQVGGLGGFRSADAVMDRQPYLHNPVADAIYPSPPETTDCFEQRIRDFADNLRCFKDALSRLIEKAPRVQPVILFRFHRGGNPDLKSATSGLRHQSSRCV